MNLDFADVKPSVLNWVVVGLMAATFIVFLKWVMQKWPVPGMSDVVNSI